MVGLYAREECPERLRWIKEARRPIRITTDIIVGFPGETNSDFEETITLLEEVGYDGVFAFKYSPRPHTPALNMIDSIVDEEKSKRLAIVLDRQREIQTTRYCSHLGRIVQLMVEGL